MTTFASLTDFTVDVDVNSLDDGGIWLRSSYNSGSLSGVLLVTGGWGDQTMDCTGTLSRIIHGVEPKGQLLFQAFKATMSILR